MLTVTQINAGEARLSAGKLTAEDVDKLVGVMKMFFQGVEEAKSYDWKTKLLALDDTSDEARTASQVAACIIEMEDLGFGVASLQGGSDATYYKEKDDYAQYIFYVHTKFYSLPAEFTTYPLSRKTSNAVSGTAMSVRVERGGLNITERSIRRWGRRYW